jgi:hypothetical protein
LQDTYQLIEKIQGNGSRTFSEEEYNELISSNSDLVASFRKIGNDFVYIGGSMDTLTSALQENAIATIQAANKQLDFLITAGTLIGENVGETGAVSDMDTN